MTAGGAMHDGRGDPPPAGFVSLILSYLRSNKRWWLTPLIAVLLFLALVALLSGLAPSLPFIYTLF